MSDSGLDQEDFSLTDDSDFSAFSDSEIHDVGALAALPLGEDVSVSSVTDSVSDSDVPDDSSEVNMT